MTKAVAMKNHAPAEILEKVVIEGDLSKLTVEERVQYYSNVCESLGLNPLTKPFAYIKLSGGLQLYALRAATDQLRKINHVSVHITDRQTTEGVYVVTADATMPDETMPEGRVDSSMGAVTITNLKGDALANALMKAETKAKRRVTLSICGLGWLDETEIETIPDAKRVDEPTDVSRLSTTPMPPGADDDLDERFAATVGDYEGKELGLPPVERDGQRPQHDEQTMTIYGKLLRATTDKKTPQAMQTWERHPRVVEARDSLPEDLREALDKNIRTQLELMMAKAE